MKIKNEIDVYFTELNFDTSVDGEKEVKKVPTKIRILPPSPFKGKNGRTYNYDPDEVILNFENNKAEIPFDINHATEIKAPKGEEAPAYAWGATLEKDEDGGVSVNNINWIDEEPITSGKYKYVSPALKSTLSGKINRITSIGIVNKGNLDLPALNSEDVEELLNNKGDDKMDKDMLKALGLDENASKDLAIQAIYDLKNKPVNVSNEELLKQVTELNMEIANQKSERFNDKKERIIEEAVKNGKILPSTKELYITTLNSEDTLQVFVDTMAKAPSIIGKSIKNPNIEEEISLNSEDAEYCKKYGLDTEEFKKKKEELFG